MDLSLSITENQSIPTAAALRQQIIAFAENYSIETTPRESIAIKSYRDILRPGTTVNIAFLPDADFADTIQTASRLRREGFNPVPHLPARAFTSEEALHDVLNKLREESDITDVLIIAGGLSKPLGPFDDTMALLETGLLAEYGILRVGIAGHPEGSPDIEPEILHRSLKAKQAFAARKNTQMHVTTQFCLDAAPIVSWERAIRQSGNTLPVDIGLAGATTLKSLLKFAKMCGVGASRRMLTRNTRRFVRLSTVSYPDRLITALAHEMLADPASRFRRLHFFPFGGLERTTAWLARIADGAFVLNDDLSGFDVSG